MATALSEMVRRVHVTLQDEEGVRWPAHEVVRYIDEGQVALCVARPDIVAREEEVQLAAGTRQTVPDDVYAFIDIKRNEGGAAISKVDVDLFDRVDRNWRRHPASATVLHYMYDLREPKVFEVYPPVTLQREVRVVALWAKLPQSLPVQTAALAAGVTGEMTLGDQWVQPLVFFALAKAYSKDAEFGGNPELAARYAGLFDAAVGQQLESASTVVDKE